jgi:hypothetical protein
LPRNIGNGFFLTLESRSLKIQHIMGAMHLVGMEIVIVLPLTDGLSPCKVEPC